MEWTKYESVKEQVELGDVLVCTFRNPESINSVLCICAVGLDGTLINVRSGNKIDGFEPEYVFHLTHPDKYPIVYFL